jgi:hypothetical protein
MAILQLHELDFAVAEYQESARRATDRSRENRVDAASLSACSK